MKQLISDFILNSLKLTKGWPYKQFYSGKVQILMFHRVVKKLGENRIINDGIEVTEEYLDSLICLYKKNGFIPISINDLTEAINEKSKKRYVIFTFDDGYADNFEKALPIFEKHKVPFTIYLTLDFIKQKQFAWWYFLEDLLKKNSVIEYLESDTTKLINFENEQSKLHFFIQLREIIQNQPEALNFLIGRYKPNLSNYYNLFLSTDQIELLNNNSLATLGSHTISHPSLARSSHDLSLHEITESKIELEKLLNKPVNHFSYPFGTKKDVSDRELKFAKQAGYRTALTTTYGDVHSETCDLFNLPRIWTGNNISKKEQLKIIYGINESSIKKAT